MTPGRARWAGVLGWQWLPLVVLVAVKLGVHLYANGSYGFLRDELAYIDDGKRLAFGFVDHPPVAPFFAAVARLIWGNDSLLGLRLMPALSSTALLVVTMLMARDLGGGRVAMALAGLAFLGAPIFLASGLLLQTVTFDVLLWGLAAWSFVRLVKSGDERWWLAIGVLIGLGLMTKYTTAFYAFGFAAGLLLTGDRRRLLSPWPWFGVGLTVLIILPNLLWQAANDFIALDYTRAISERDQAIRRTDGFFPEQFLVMGPPGAIVWLAGLWWLFRREAGRPYRALAWTSVLVILLFALMQGRGYYTAAVYPAVMAAGCVALERLPWQRWRTALLGGLSVMLVASAVFAMSVTLPVVSPGSGYFEFASDLNEDLPEMIGWPELVATIAEVRDGLPAGERGSIAVLAGNFGQAGAVNLYGPRHGLPEVISPVNSYHAWSRDRLEADVYIVLGFDEATLRGLFGSVEAVATVRNDEGVENQEWGRVIYVCRQPRVPLADRWEALRRFG